MLLFLAGCSLEKRMISNVHSINEHGGHSGLYAHCSKCNVKGNIGHSHENYSFSLDQQVPIENNIDGKGVDKLETISLVGLDETNKHFIKSNHLWAKELHYKSEVNVDCDLIILKNGNAIEAKVIEVGVTEIKYKLCDNLDGPIFIIEKTAVFMLKYPNGSTTIISPVESNENNTQISTADVKEIEPLSLISFISSLVGLFIFGIPLGIASIIMSAIGQQKINNNPEKWKGKGLAIAGLVIGIVDIIGALIFLAMVV